MRLMKKPSNGFGNKYANYCLSFSSKLRPYWQSIVASLLVVVQEAVVNQEEEVIFSVSIEICNQTFPGFCLRSSFPADVEVFLKDAEMEYTLPL